MNCRTPRFAIIVTARDSSLRLARVNSSTFGIAATT